MASTRDIAILGAGDLLAEALTIQLQAQESTTGRVRLFTTDEELSLVDIDGEEWLVDDLEEFEPSGFRYVFIAAADEAFESLAEDNESEGTLFLDVCGMYSDDASVPRISAWMGAESRVEAARSGLVTLPGAQCAQLAAVLAPLQVAFGVERIEVTGLNAVSAYGRAAVEELATQTRDLLTFRSITQNVFSGQIAFNVLPAIGDFDEEGSAALEKKVSEELAAAMPGLPAPGLTFVQVPVFYGDTQIVSVELHQSADLARILEVLAQSADLSVLDWREEGHYPSPVTEASGEDRVVVGRIRLQGGNPRRLQLCSAADNLRFGLALQGARIADLLEKEYI